MTKKVQNRNTVRSSFFAIGEKNGKLVDLVGADGQKIEVEVREPNFRQMASITKKGSASDDKPNGNDFWIWAIIECTYMPGTETKVFEDADYDFFLEKQIRDTAIAELTDAVTSFILVTDDDVDEAKND